jgi:hypothetical protein
MNPLIHESKDFDIIINHSEVAKEKELFKFKAKKKDKTFEVPADTLLQIIADNFKQKDLATALMDVTQSVIPAVEARLPIHFIADKDYNKGDVVQFTAPIILPAFIAHVMDAYKLAIDNKENPVLPVPRATYEEAEKQFEAKNREFVETFWKKEIDIVKKAEKPTEDNSTDTA